MDTTSPDSEPAGPARQRAVRSDFTRNRSRILDTAARVLEDDPAAGLAEIAEAAGMGRATVYRHFSSRDEVMDALREHGIEQFVARLKPIAEPFQGDATPGVPVFAAIERMADEALRLRHPYCRVMDRDPQMRAALTESLCPYVEVVLAYGQRTGELTTSLTIPALMTVVRGLVFEAGRAMRAGEISSAVAGDLVRRTLFEGIATRTDRIERAA